MHIPSILISALASLLISGCATTEPVVWHPDNLDNIDGHPVEVEGNPRVIDTPNGKAIGFDGVDDGIFLGLHPAADMSVFTVEVIFNPYRQALPNSFFSYAGKHLGSAGDVLDKTG